MKPAGGMPGRFSTEQYGSTSWGRIARQCSLPQFCVIWSISSTRWFRHRAATVNFTWRRRMLSVVLIAVRPRTRSKEAHVDPLMRSVRNATDPTWNRISLPSCSDMRMPGFFASS